LISPLVSFKCAPVNALFTHLVLLVLRVALPALCSVAEEERGCGFAVGDFSGGPFSLILLRFSLRLVRRFFYRAHLLTPFSVAFRFGFAPVRLGHKLGPLIPREFLKVDQKILAPLLAIERGLKTLYEVVVAGQALPPFCSGSSSRMRTLTRRAR